MKPYKVSIPSESLIASALNRVDYADAFAIKTTTDIAVSKLPPLFFKSIPAWFAGLMYVREFFAGLVGLKTGKGSDVERQLAEFTGAPGESIALFKVLDSTAEEIMSGQDDRHLDFRLSFFSRRVGEETEIILATTVQFNATSGKIYFIPVGPIHRLIVPILLKRMVKTLEDGSLVSSKA